MPVNSFENYPMSWKPNLANVKPPLYKALAQKLEEDILSGLLKPGDMLPPQRELADFLDLNLSTITKAFKLCSQKGLISSSIGRGTFVAADTQVDSTLLAPTKAAGLIEMGAIHPAYEFNDRIQKLMLNTIHSNMHNFSHCNINFLEYNIPTGTSFQKQTGAYWLQYAGLHTTSEQILLTNGGQNALFTAFASLFQAGDKVGADPLVFAGAKTAAKMLGIQLIAIPSTDNEMSPELLEQYCKMEGLKGLYLIPDYQNPTTHTMSLEGRKAIAEIAKKYRLIIVEDAINSLLNEKPLPPIAHFLPEQTVYLSSLSKVLCPGIQIAFIYTPLRYKSALKNGIYTTNLMVSPLNAEVACQLIHSPLCEEILSQRREMTIERNRWVNTILNGYHVLGDLKCNFRLLVLPDGWSGRSFELCAKNAGVQVYCGERFAIGTGHVMPCVRLAITTPSHIDDLKRGLYILKNILDSNLQDEFTML